MIETSRLLLRQWNAEDLDALTDGLNDLAVAKWLAFVPHPYTTSHAEDWIRRCQELSNAGARPDAYEFAIELRAQHRLVGGVSINEIDWNAGTAGGGIWIASPHHGKGYGGEAFDARIRFAFFNLGLTQLINGYLDGNANSWAMQRKLGYRHTGETRARHCMADGRQTIEHMTTLRRSDYTTVRDGADT